MAEPSKIKPEKGLQLRDKQNARRKQGLSSNKIPASVGITSVMVDPRPGLVQTQEEWKSKGPAEGNQPQARIDSSSDAGEKTCNHEKRWSAQIAAAARV